MALNQDITGSDKGIPPQNDFQAVTYDEGVMSQERAIVSRESNRTKAASQSGEDEDVTSELESLWKRETHYINTIDHLTK